MMFYRNIGHIQHSAFITVDVESGKLYVHRCLWCIFAFEAKFEDGFEGNLVDFGRASDSSSFHTSSNENYSIQHLKYSPHELTAMFKPLDAASSFPRG